MSINSELKSPFNLPCNIKILFNFAGVRAIQICLFLSVLFLLSCNKEQGGDRFPTKEELENIEVPQLNSLNEAIKADPEDHLLFYKRSKLNLDLNRKEEALKDINQAIQLDKSENKYYLQLAKVYYEIGNPTLALNAGQRAEEMNLIDPELYILLAKIYRELGNSTFSEFYLNKAIGVAPFHSDVYLLKAKINASKGDSLAAVNNLYFALARDNKNQEVYKEFIKLYERKKMDSAYYFILEGRKLNSKDPYYTAYEGKILDRLNLKESALNAYKTAVIYDSTFGPSYLFLAKLYIKENKKDLALDQMYKYVKYQEFDPEGYKLTGQLLEESGKPEQSISWYEKAAIRDTSDHKLKTNLEKLYKAYPNYKMKISDSVSVKNDTLAKRDKPAANNPIKTDTTKLRRREPVRRPDTLLQPKKDSVK